MTTATKLPPFQRLLEEHGDDVLGFLIASVGPGEAEDCFQETLLAALRSYDGLGDARNLKGWLMTIAHRKAVDHHRARSRAPWPVADPSAGVSAGPGSGGSGDPALNGSGDLWGLVGALPAKQRSALALRFAGDMAYRQIGRALDCSEEAARRSVHEGLKRLREELA